MTQANRSPEIPGRFMAVVVGKSGVFKYESQPPSDQEELAREEVFATCLIQHADCPDHLPAADGRRGREVQATCFLIFLKRRFFFNTCNGDVAGWPPEPVTWSVPGGGLRREPHLGMPTLPRCPLGDATC